MLPLENAAAKMPASLFGIHATDTHLEVSEAPSGVNVQVMIGLPPTRELWSCALRDSRLTAMQAHNGRHLVSTTHAPSCGPGWPDLASQTGIPWPSCSPTKRSLPSFAAANAWHTGPVRPAGPLLKASPRAGSCRQARGNTN